MANIIPIFFDKKNDKKICVKFLLKFVIVYSKQKVGFNCKNNYKRNKFANFWLYILNLINCRTSHILYLMMV